MKALVNAKVVTVEKVIEDGVVLMDKGRITEIGKATDVRIPEGCGIIDAQGCYAGPGLVEIHCHGGDRYEAYEEPAKMAAYHLSHGTTSLTESIAYNVSSEKTLAGIDRIKKRWKTRIAASAVFYGRSVQQPRFRSELPFRSTHRPERI